jgi:hypothetical protein
MVVFMNKDDMVDRQIEPDSLVELKSAAAGGDARRTASGFKVRPYNIPCGSIAAYDPETDRLLPLSYHDRKSKTPSAKSIPVVVRSIKAPRDRGRRRRTFIDLVLDLKSVEQFGPRGRARKSSS